ncbi:MFS transporter, DHA1 family, inner membrane transport protein [Kytococcus aerolatus]|uniref:MFS transporter, DHA1 family, inner membrane transport protein n=1 Tax=Kytococcus aerolatus TaxID=592308 RepID=A0A212TDZ3_9MICO|nr:MFS transporter [Kytococcus aerolatus]SNC64051.1 MFS transporter, DHA1 family, inner membrane transport protein [Kytococcus aerolatus]
MPVARGSPHGLPVHSLPHRRRPGGGLSISTPDTRPRTLILWLAAATFAIGLTEFAAMTLLPHYAAEFGVTEPQASRAVSAYAIGVVVGAPVLSLGLARWDRRVSLLALLGLFTVGNLLAAAAPSLGLLVAARFVAGLPHGALFGIAQLVAATSLGRDRAAQAVAWVATGLTVATVVGVPGLSVLGQATSWRLPFVLVAVLAVVCAVALARLVPQGSGGVRRSARAELGAFTNPDVLLPLAMGAIGFGGLFAVYSFLSATLMSHTHAPAWAVPLVLMAYGVGGIIGNLLAGRTPERRLLLSAGLFQLLIGVATLVYSTTVDHWWLMLFSVALVGIGGGLVVPLQTRIMHVAGEAQTMAAALNHAAFNAANAIGPAVAGAALAAGWGWRSTGWVGAGLSLAGLAVWAVIMLRERARQGDGARPVVRS